MHYESELREALILDDKTAHDITEDVCRPIEGKANKYWKWAFGIACLALLWWIIAVSYTVGTGLGVWGINKTVGWAWDITNFVWWVGIGHAGTLISAILLLFRQKWRLSINRSAEAMTIFAVICAASFIVSHMGRPWVAYWPLPLPNQFGSLWVNFNSPLVWDVFAISTYFTVSLVFWYTGLIPDFAVVRDRAKTKARKFWYTILSFGWTGTAKNWQRFEEVSLVLAGLSTPLVLSVHSVVSMDFATSVIPGWHTTIFPPYFVAGAIFSGFAMVQSLLIIVRKVFALEDYITIGHIDLMNKVIVLTGSIVGIAYLTELFMGWYSQNKYEGYTFWYSRAYLFSPYGWSYWGMMACNVLSPQIFWSRKMRRNVFVTFFMSIIVNIGMWFERFVIIVTSLYRDYLPSSWSVYYSPTIWEIGFYAGTFGLFFTCFFLFAKYFPVIAIAEIKYVLKTTGDGYKEQMSAIEAQPLEAFVKDQTHHH